MIKLNKSETKLVTALLVITATLLSLGILAGFFQSLSIELSHIKFYTVLRLLACTGFAFAGYLAHQKRLENCVFLFIAFAAVYNPIVPLHMGQTVWGLVDAGAIGMLWLAYKKLL